MQKSLTYKTVTAGLLVALGLILPFFTSHAFGVPGTILLPMHIPVLLCGLLCGPRFGAVVGLAVPLLSSLVTGMPAMYPMLPIMAAQLAVMGLLSGLLYEKARLHIYPALLISMASGWAVYGLVYALLLFTGSGGLSALSVGAALLQGVPGIIIQLILVPLLVMAVGRFRGRKHTGRPDKALDEAREIIKSRKASFIVIQQGTIIHTDEGRGVSPILRLYDSEPQKLAGASVADKIIGKAAAMILVLGNVRMVYGEIMSAAAHAYLKERGVPVEYGRCVDVINARNDKGICPIERSVMEIDDPQEGLEKLRATIAQLMQKAG